MTRTSVMLIILLLIGILGAIIYPQVSSWQERKERERLEQKVMDMRRLKCLTLGKKLIESGLQDEELRYYKKYCQSGPDSLP